MVRQIPIINVDETYAYPIYRGIVSRLVHRLGVPTDTYIGMLNESVNKDEFEDSSYVYFSATPTSSTQSLINNPNVISNTLPLLYDNDFNMSIIPVYSEERITIDINIGISSRVLSTFIYSNLIGLTKNNNTFGTSGKGTFVLGDFPLALIENMLRIKNQVLDEEKTLEEYINDLKTDRLDYRTNMSGNGDVLVSSEFQEGMSLSFDTDKVPPEYDQNLGIWIVNFKINIELKLPKFMQITYQPMIFNTYLDSHFLPINTDLEKQENYVYYRDLIIKTSEIKHYNSWTITDGIMSNGPFNGTRVDDSFTGNFIDLFPDFGKTEIVSGYMVSGPFVGYDFGVNIDIIVDDLFDSIPFSVEVVDGVISEYPLKGIDLDIPLNDTISGTLINGVVYGGLLDGIILNDAIGGVIINNVIYGGHFNGAILDGEFRNFQIVYGETIIENDKLVSITGLLENNIPSIRVAPKHIDVFVDPLKEVIDKLDSYNGLMTKNIDILTNTIVNVPFYDSFNPPAIQSIAPFISILVKVEDYDNTRLFNLKNMGLYSISSELINFTKEHGTNSLINGIGEFPLNILLYENEKYVPNGVQLNFETMELSTVTPMDKLKTYRIVLSTATTDVFMTTDIREKTGEIAGSLPLLNNLFTSANVTSVVLYKATDNRRFFRVVKNIITLRSK